MAFHTRFVVTNLVGRTVIWRSPPRDERETSWREAVRYHGFDTVVGSAWALSVHWMNPEYFWWLVPVVGALVLSIPVSVLASRVRIGEALRRWRIFVTPEELSPPKEIQTLDELCDLPPPDRRKPDGFVRAVVDPGTNAIHQHLLRGPRRLAPAIRDARTASAERALARGPDVLTPRERRTLLLDAGALEDLHRRVWALDDVHAAARWGLGTEAEAPDVSR
jgi:membrane glycosyltransferase